MQNKLKEVEAQHVQTIDQQDDEINSLENRLKELEKGLV